MRLRAFWVLVAVGSAVVLGEADLYQQQYPAGSEGLAACSENVQGNHCWRADNPRPTEVCVERDPVSQICLRVIPSAAAAVLPERETGYVDLEMSASGGTVTCSGEDPYCVPDGVHLGTEIDWSTVEGAEFLVLPTAAASSSDTGPLELYVDSNMGDDESSDGSRHDPFRTLKRALARWLQPGRCYPYCSMVGLDKSAVIYLQPGMFSGSANRGIELLIPKGTNLTLSHDPYASETGTYGLDMARDTSVVLSNDHRQDAWNIKASGEGSLSLLGITLRNSSSPALLISPSINLNTDLQMAYGRFGEWVQAGGIRTPAWDASNDRRSRGRTIDCSSSDLSCSIGAEVFGTDPLFQGEYSASASACTDCGVASPVGYQGDNGLGVTVEEGGTGCLTPGTLISVGRGPGSGFRADFSITDGAISGISVIDPGSGYKEGSEVSIVIGTGGLSCSGFVITPWLAVSPHYVTSPAPAA